MVLGESNHNIFSGTPEPYNADYFKSLWSRFKTQTNILEQAQTLYSFRHSGAIEIFKTNRLYNQAAEGYGALFYQRIA